MKKIALPCVLMLSVLSCTSTEKKEINTDTVSVTEQKSSTQGKFDLSTISFKETVEDLLKKEGLTVSDSKPVQSTLAGYKPFLSTSPKLLVFDGQALSGKAGANENSLVLHYALKGNVVDSYEAMIYTQNEASALEKALNQKFGKSVFLKDSGLDTLSKRLDENGEEIKGPREDIKYERWEDKKNGVAYHLVVRTTAKKLTVAEFTAINLNSKDAKNWIQYKMLGFYY